MSKKAEAAKTTRDTADVEWAVEQKLFRRYADQGMWADGFTVGFLVAVFATVLLGFVFFPELRSKI